MPKIILDDITNLQNESTVVGVINNNNQKIEEAIEKTLSRDGTLPNNMAATLDMNSNRIINLPNAIENSEPVTLGQLQDIEDITANTFITVLGEPSLPQSRKLSSGTNISISDAGAQSDIFISVDNAELNALALAGSAANTIPYYTSQGQANTTPLTGYARSLIDDANAEEARATLILDQINNTSDLDKPISTATQNALNSIIIDVGDLQADKADKIITVSAGTGLTGGGDLSANRSIALDSTSVASLGKADTAVQPTRSITAGTGLTGGGDLSANRTIALDSAAIASLGKADTAVQPGDLATVATTGDYLDLSNLPTLGGLAAKNKITVPSDIDYTGTPDGSKFLRDDGAFVSIPGGGDMLASNNLSDLASVDAALANLGANLAWYARGIGEIVYVDTSIAGVSVPPQSHADLVYIELTAGKTGSGAYNNGKLTSESVSGSAPLTEATATISVVGSPINGKTVHLINTEEAILRPRASGVGSLQQDQMQQITGSFTSYSGGINTAAGAFSKSGSGYRTDPTISIENSANFDSANSPGARAGSETRMKNVGVTAYMRVK